MDAATNGAGGVFDNAIPVAAALARDIKLEDHVHTGGRIGLEAVRHSVKNTLNIAFSGTRGLLAAPVFARRRDEGKNGRVGILHFFGPVHAIDFLPVRMNLFGSRRIIRISQLNRGTGQYGCPVEIAHAAVEDRSGFPAFIAAEIHHHGGDKLRFRFFEKLGWHDIFGQPRGGNGGHGIHLDVVFFPFQFQGVHQSHQPHLGGRIIGLAEISIQAGRRSGHDDPPVSIFFHQRHGRTGHMISTVQMHIHHGFPVIGLHL